MSCIFEMELPMCKGCTTRRDCWCCDKIGDWIIDHMGVEQHGDLISRSALLDKIRGKILDKDEIKDALDRQYNKGLLRAIQDVKRAPSVDAEPTVITGETSDGYHTFNELYHHRAALFSVVVKAFPEKAWKARQHHDGTMYDGMFIVGIDTPEGQASYHYYLDPYWEMFDCRELERAPDWDGHTPEQAIERIGMLEPVRHGEWLNRLNGMFQLGTCSVCGSVSRDTGRYCPNCGARMDGGGGE